jgi:HlyD family secretion protein
MSRTSKIVVAVVAVVLVATVASVVVARGKNRGVEVRIESVELRDLVATVTANGNIRATRSVDISSDVTGRVVELNAVEGEEVREGQVLLRIDATASVAATSRAEAALAQSRSQASQQEASLIRAQRDFDRVDGLWRRDSLLVSRQQVEDAESQLEVARATLEAARQGVQQALATLEENRDRLAKTTIRAPISGKVTRLNIELGETAVIGTMNNPGSLLLTVSDLSVIEAVMQVDETDVPRISVGDSAMVEIDAFPDRMFRGSVTRIGNSAIQPPTQGAGGQTSTIDFEVVITLDATDVELRPDLSATADVIISTRTGVPSIPIIALTVRDDTTGAARAQAADTGATTRARGPLARAGAPRVEEGVFVVREGTVRFQPVVVGIAGQDFFEVISGVAVGDSVVSGPYQRIRELQDGDVVRPVGTGQTSRTGR